MNKKSILFFAVGLLTAVILVAVFNFIYDATSCSALAKKFGSVVADRYTYRGNCLFSVKQMNADGKESSTWISVEKTLLNK